MSHGASHHVRFDPVGRVVDARAGETIAEAAARAGLTLVSACGGLGICAGCRVHVTGAASAEPSRARLTAAQLGRGERLACATAVEGDLVVTVPPDLGAGARKSETLAKPIEPLWPSGAPPGPIDAASVAMLVASAEHDVAIQLAQLRSGRVLFEVREPLDPLQGWDALVALAGEALRAHGFAPQQVKSALVLASQAGRRFDPDPDAQRVEGLGAHWRRAAEVGFPAHPEAAVARLGEGVTGPSFVALGALAAFEQGASCYVQLGGAPQWGGRDTLWLVADRDGHWAATKVASPGAWSAKARRALVREALGEAVTERASSALVVVGTSGAAPTAAERALLGGWLDEVPPSAVRFLGDGRLAGLHVLLTSRSARVSWGAHDPVLHPDELTTHAPPPAERVISCE